LPAGHHGHGHSIRHRARPTRSSGLRRQAHPVPQLRALGSYRKRSGARDYPKETTFQRVLAKLDAEAFERILIEWEIQRAGQE
jgi:hypothetical protein